MDYDSYDIGVMKILNDKDNIINHLVIKNYKNYCLICFFFLIISLIIYILIKKSLELVKNNLDNNNKLLLDCINKQKKYNNKINKIKNKSINKSINKSKKENKIYYSPKKSISKKNDYELIENILDESNILSNDLKYSNYSFL